MSASLVGSEMCIRDSSSPLTTYCGSFCAVPLASEFPLTAVAAPASPGPVSYTHLTLPTICSV
eukprot:14551813-Alexandrium_andersonii.AAC.1